MKKNDFIKLTILAAVFCISGQSARETVVMKSEEVAKQEPVEEVVAPPAPAVQKGAAKRVVEGSRETTYVTKGAAKRAVEAELNY